MRVTVKPGAAVTLALLLAALEPWEALLIALAALGHEGGHLLFLRLCGDKKPRLTLDWGGFRLEPGRMLSYGEEALVALAGPGASLLFAAAGAWAGALGAEKLYVFSGASLVLGLMNLLPLSPLDGGRALRAGLGFFLAPDAVYFLSRLLDALTLALLLALSLTALLRWHNPTLLVSAALLTVCREK